MITLDIIFQFGEFFNETSWLSDFFAMLFAVIIPFIVLYIQVENDIKRKKREQKQSEEQFYNHFKLLAGKCVKTIDKQIVAIDDFISKFKIDEPCIFRVNEVVKSDLKNFIGLTSTPEAFNIIRKINPKSDSESIFYGPRYSVERSLEIFSLLKEKNSDYLILTQDSISKLKSKVEEGLVFELSKYVQSLSEEKYPPKNIQTLNDILQQYYRLGVQSVKLKKTLTTGDLSTQFLIPMTQAMVSLMGSIEAEQFLDRLRIANWIFDSALSNQEKFLEQVNLFKRSLIEDRDQIEKSLIMMVDLK